MIDSPRRVLVDLSHLYPDGLSGGIKPALLEMLRWLASCKDQPIHFVHVTRATTHAEVAALARPVDRLIPAGKTPRDLAARELCDVVYCPFGSTEFSCPGIPTVTLIADLLHRDFPSSIAREEVTMREQWFNDAVERSDVFQVISGFTAGQLQAHYGVEPARMVITYLPLQRRFTRQHDATRIADHHPFFYYPANAWVHKNHIALLQAYAAYRRREGLAAWRLVLTGADNSAMEAIRSLAGKLGLESHIDFLGYVNEAQLASLWSGASALVFPSLYEGFGIPLLEAMAHNIPIITSRAGSIPEITGNAALLVDAQQPAELAEGMRRISNDAELRKTLTIAGHQQLQKFSPDREFGILKRALAEVARKPALWRRAGYYMVDGLTDPEAIFALPPTKGTGSLEVDLRPLPADRHLQIWCGPDLVGEIDVLAGRSAKGFFKFEPRVQVVTLRVTNAQSLSETDPRVHGVLLQTLIWHDATGAATMLAP